MRSSRTVAVLLASAALAVASTACSSSGPATPDDPTLARGQEVFNARCASCHGADGGGGFGKKLAGEVEENFPNIDDQIAVVTNGREGTNMPAFGDQLSDEDIEAVVRYTRESLG